jgi:alkanesulfonate monooxygenase SsuD/methylene tetrahydromethanopterin reductase-like flavin-dependent oxidoreductase (luciferase family)
VTQLDQVRIGIKTSPQDTDWVTLDATWARIGEHDVFESAWVNDHLTNARDLRGGASLEALTTLAALAHHVRGKWLGIAVLSATFRHPAVLAKQLTVLDHVSGGHLIVGLGAGWHDPEHGPFGIPFPPIVERFDRFESALAVIRALFSDPARTLPGVTRPDPYVPLAGATNEPGTLTPGGPPIWLGGQRRRGIDLAARHAQGWITPFLLPGGRTDRLAYFVELRARLLSRMAEIGRDPAGFEFAIQVPTGVTAESRRDGLRLALDAASAGASHIVLSMPPDLGPQAIDAVASELAIPLRQALG